MDATSTDHPLRPDPLNYLPDAVTVPRRPRPRAVSATPSPRLNPNESVPPASPLQLPVTSTERHEFEQEAAALLDEGNDDPLLVEVVARANQPPSPPAGRAYATNIDEMFMAIDERGHDEDAPTAAGIVDRSDVTLFVAETKKGSAAGVFMVRSRKNWTFAVSGAGVTSSPTSEDYYHVRRSLADFSWLEEVLTSRYEGVIVPTLPTMALAGRLRHGLAYDGERLRGLERFLRRVTTHAVLSTGKEVLAFLGATGEDVWRKIRREPISHESSITTALFGASAHEARNPWERIGLWSEKILWQAGRKVNKGLVWFLDRDENASAKRADSSEARVERLQAYVKDLRVSLTALRQAAERVSRNRSKEARGVEAMQKALNKFGEREGGKLGSFLENVVLDISAEDNLRQAENSGHLGGAVVDRILEDVFQDYDERAKGAQRIMNSRQEEQDAYEHALSVYTKLRDRLESRTGSMWETERSSSSATQSGEGFEELVNDVSAASSRLADVRRRYQAVAVSTTDELRRFRSDMHEDLCRVLQTLAEEFARQHEAHAQAWKRLHDVLAECRDKGRIRR